MNSGPPVPQTGALTGLRYAPTVLDVSGPANRRKAGATALVGPRAQLALAGWTARTARMLGALVYRRRFRCTRSTWARRGCGAGCDDIARVVLQYRPAQLFHSIDPEIGIVLVGCVDRRAKICFGRLTQVTSRYGKRPGIAGLPGDNPRGTSVAVSVRLKRRLPRFPGMVVVRDAFLCFGFLLICEFLATCRNVLFSRPYPRVIREWLLCRAIGERNQKRKQKQASDRRSSRHLDVQLQG